jgi:hypothetical protein
MCWPAVARGGRVGEGASPCDGRTPGRLRMAAAGPAPPPYAVGSMVAYDDRPADRRGQRRVRRKRCGGEPSRKGFVPPPVGRRRGRELRRQLERGGGDESAVQVERRAARTAEMAAEHPRQRPVHQPPGPVARLDAAAARHHLAQNARSAAERQLRAPAREQASRLARGRGGRPGGRQTRGPTGRWRPRRARPNRGRRRSLTRLASAAAGGLRPGVGYIDCTRSAPPSTPPPGPGSVR